MKHRYMLPILVIAVLPVAAPAGGTATATTTDGQMHIAWSDAAVRIDVDDGTPDDYLVLRDGSLYLVTREHDHPMVLDMSGMIRTFTGMANGDDSAFSRAAIDRIGIESVQNTGETREVAGIKGIIHTIKATGPDGRKVSAKVILTDDPLVVEMTQAVLNGFFDALDAGDKTSQLRAALPQGYHGVLGVQRGAGMQTLQSITHTSPDADRFQLPAEPRNLAELVREMMQKRPQDP